MRIFCDCHHEELYESLRILFEDRLGWEMYRSIGLDWWKQGYWKVYDHPATAEQYLGFHIGEAFKQNLEDLQKDDPLVNHGTHTFRMINVDIKEYDGIYTVGSIMYPGVRYKAITLDRMKDIKFDVFLSSMPAHVPAFNRLIELYQPHAKHIFQIGNNWPTNYPVRNILSSAKSATWGSDKHGMYYHQEFDSKNLFNLVPPTYPQSMYNLMHYIQNPKSFEQLEQMLGPDWTCKMYGSGGRDGPRGPSIQDIAAAHKESAFLWHVKREGDGYGYNVFHSAACGRPIITRKSHYRGMTAEPLLIHGLTCIDLDKVDHAGSVAAMMGVMLSLYPELSANIRKTFERVVDFDEEAKQIKLFMENLI